MRWERPLPIWRPRRAGREAQVSSLCEHLLARYPTPSPLWGAFTDRAAGRLAPIAAEVARGGSLYRLVQARRLAVPLTRKQCHELLTGPGNRSFLAAMRTVQVRGEGGHGALVRAWLATDPATSLHTRAQEELWRDLLAVLARAPSLDVAQVGPLIDYVVHLRRGDRLFRIKGRTAASLLRGMERWHRTLARADGQLGDDYPDTFVPSGFVAGALAHPMRERRGKEERRLTYRVQEILTKEDQRAEGREQEHCVYSYGGAIARGTTSIWSMTIEEEGSTDRALTVEVQNRHPAIVQARGLQNRLPTEDELHVLHQWAALNGLCVRV